MRHFDGVPCHSMFRHRAGAASSVVPVTGSSTSTYGETPWFRFRERSGAPRCLPPLPRWSRSPLARATAAATPRRRTSTVADPSRTSRARTPPRPVSSSQIIDAWNADAPGRAGDVQGAVATTPIRQHDDLVQHLQAKQSDYDVVALDVPWTAEFAAKGWLQPLTGEFAVDNTGILPATVDSATYNGTPVRGAEEHQRRPAVLPQRPAARRTEDVGRAGRRVRGREDQQHRLLRRSVRTVRGPDGEHRRGHQRVRRLVRRRGRQDADRRQPRGPRRPAGAGRRLQER